MCNQLCGHPRCARTCGLLSEKKIVPHKHAATIKAWADGAVIECRPPPNGRYFPEWLTIPKYETIIWREELEYRVKPEPKPDYFMYGCVSSKKAITNMWNTTHNRVLHTSGLWSENTVNVATDYETIEGTVKYTFDGESGKLKSVEKI